MALLIALGNRDCFVELIVLQRARNLLNEYAGLLTRRTEHQRAVNHDTDRPGRHNKEKHDDSLRRDAHVVPHGHQIPTDVRVAAALQHQETCP